MPSLVPEPRRKKTAFPNPELVGEASSFFLEYSRLKVKPLTTGDLG